MKTTPKDQNNGTKSSDSVVAGPQVKSMQLTHQYKELLAQVGQLYLVQQNHQAQAQECAQRIQQLRAHLGGVEQELRALQDDAIPRVVSAEPTTP